MSVAKELRDALNDRIKRFLRRSLYVIRVDSGSCNGCEIEIFATLSPLYDVERFGIRLVASPRHADAMIVTGPVTRQFKPVLRRVYEALPEPKIVIAVGACACGGGVWYDSYAVEGGVDKVVPVDVYVPGCPPHPAAILHGLLLALDLVEQKMRRTSFREAEALAQWMKPRALELVERSVIPLTWELHRELENVCRKYLGYLYGSMLLREYLELLARCSSIEELESRSKAIAELWGGDPRISEVIAKLNNVVKDRLRRARGS